MVDTILDKTKICLNHMFLFGKEFNNYHICMFEIVFCISRAQYQSVNIRNQQPTQIPKDESFRNISLAK